jgi:hypothetical protein
MVATIEMKAIEFDIQDLARQFALSPAETHDMLWNEIHYLEQAARIQDFVPLLALKHVKQSLRENPPEDVIFGLA